MLFVAEDLIDVILICTLFPRVIQLFVFNYFKDHFRFYFEVLALPSPVVNVLNKKGLRGSGYSATS